MYGDAVDGGVGAEAGVDVGVPSAETAAEGQRDADEAALEVVLLEAPKVQRGEEGVALNGPVAVGVGESGQGPVGLQQLRPDLHRQQRPLQHTHRLVEHFPVLLCTLHSAHHSLSPPAPTPNQRVLFAFIDRGARICVRVCEIANQDKEGSGYVSGRKRNAQ